MERTTDEAATAFSLTILITGALRDGSDLSAKLSAFTRKVEAVLLDTWPEFLPGAPPITVITSELRDDLGALAEQVRQWRTT